MIDYIDWIEDQGTNPLWVLDEIIGQRNFLKSTPKLGDFVPTNKDGEVYDPKVVASYNLDHNMGSGIQDKFRTEYQSALDRVIWKGWKFCFQYIGYESYSNGDKEIGFRDGSPIKESGYSTYENLITSGVKLERIQRK